MSKRASLKGHKLTIDTRGSQGSYKKGFCECGWHSAGWDTKCKDVRDSHEGHILSLIKKLGEQEAMSKNSLKAWIKFQSPAKAKLCRDTIHAYGAELVSRGGPRKTLVTFLCASPEDAKRIARSYPARESVGWETTEAEKRERDELSRECSGQ